MATFTYQDTITEYDERAKQLKHKFPNLHVPALTPALLAELTQLRDSSTSIQQFVFLTNKLCQRVIEKAIDTLPYRTHEITTPTKSIFQGCRLRKEVLGVSILRAGEAMEMALRSIVPSVKLGKILVQRDESSHTKQAKLFYSKLPANLKDHHVLLLDPMLASANSSLLAIEILLNAGLDESDITFVSLIAAPEGITRLCSTHPGVNVQVLTVDVELNDQRYIIPGLGDLGDRYFGTEGL